MMDRRFLARLFSLRIHPEAWTFVGWSALVTALLALTPWSLLAWLGVAITLGIALFFRNPPRHTPCLPQAVFSPADGTIVEITREAPPAELGLTEGTFLATEREKAPTLEKADLLPDASFNHDFSERSCTDTAVTDTSALNGGLTAKDSPAGLGVQSPLPSQTVSEQPRSAPTASGQRVSELMESDLAVAGKDRTAQPPHMGGESWDGWTKIGIFLSPLDVHMNRVPCSAVVRQRFYRPGSFSHVAATQTRHDNERLSLVLQTAAGTSIVCTQIAGFLARRIVCYANERDRLVGGALYGLICFGSRVDLYIPTQALQTLLVCPGQRVRAGESVLAMLKSSPQI